MQGKEITTVTMQASSLSGYWKRRLPADQMVEGSNYVDVNFQIDPRTGRVIMMGAMDNLVKGAAGQAVQNMNLMFGLPEKEGLNLVPMFP